MSSEIVKVDSKDITIDYPSSLQEVAIQQIRPKIVGEASSIVQTGADIVKASVSIIEETRVEVAFILRRGEEYRRRTIPVIAKAKAQQDGRNTINNMGLDDDIRAAAQSELNENFRRG